MAHNSVKLIGAGYYHIYSRFVLGDFCSETRKITVVDGEVGFVSEMPAK